MRAVDRLTLDLDHRQLEEIEQKPRGGPLIFAFLVDGTVQCGDRIGRLYAANNQLTYDVSEGEWIRLLSQLGYGSYVTLEAHHHTRDVTPSVKTPRPAGPAADRSTWPPSAPRSSRPSRTPATCTSPKAAATTQPPAEALRLHALD
jgi:hypothetical protein